MAEAWEREYEAALKKADEALAHARDTGYVLLRGTRLGRLVIEYANFKYTFHKMGETEVLAQGTKRIVRGWLASAYADSEQEQIIRLKAAVRDLTFVRRNGEMIIYRTRVGNIIARYKDGTYSLNQYGGGKSIELTKGKLAVVKAYLATVYVLEESPE